MQKDKNAILNAIDSIKKLLDAKDLKKGKLLLFLTGLVAVADVIALAIVVPILMLAIDGNFLAKSSKLRAFYGFLGLKNEGGFLIALILMVVFFFITKNIIAIFIQKKIHDLGTLMVQKFTEKSFYHVVNQSFEKVSKKGSSEFLNKIHFNSLYFSTGILLPFVNVFGESLVILLIMGLIIYFNPLIFIIIVLITAPAFYFINKVIKKKIYLLGKKSKENRDETIESLNIGANGLMDIKINQSSKFFINDFLKKQKPLVESDLKAIFYQNIPARVNEIIVLFAVIFLVVYGFFYSQNPAGLRTLAAVFVLSVFRLVPAINRLLIGVMKLKLYQHTSEFLISNEAENVMPSHHNISFNHEVSVKGVYFKYNDASIPLLDNISFDIKNGEAIGITGLSGSGKSTLMKIVCGLIVPQKGGILVDNQLLNEDNLNHWLQKIAFVHQVPFVFNKSLAENISLSEIYDLSKIEEAIRGAGLYDFVNELPQGIKTWMGEQGANISEGQKQRIAIARALYKSCKLLIFDEATSSLDQQTEAIVMETLNNLKKQNVAIIIIAHHGKIIDICDTIYKLENSSLIRIKE